MDWSPITDFWEAIKNLVSEVVGFIILPFQFIYDCFVGILGYLINLLETWHTALDTMLATVSSSWINPVIPLLPPEFTTAMQFCNSVFPLDLFFNCCVNLVQLWVAALGIRLAIRIFTLGQA